MAYATVTELGFAIPAAAVARVSSQQQQWHLDTASGTADSYLRARYAVPIPAPYPRELAGAVAAIAAFDLLCSLGFNPQEFDSVYQARRDSALQWLRDVSSGKAALADTADATPGQSIGRASITSLPSRGWDGMMSTAGWSGDDCA